MRVESEGFFKLPQTRPDVGSEFLDVASKSEPCHFVLSPAAETDARSNDWMDAAATHPEPVALRTWEGFNTGQWATHAPSLLSEAGPGAYDSMLNWPTDPLELKNTNSPVVETQPYFASLLALSLGRESVFFVRDHSDSSFKCVLPGFRIPGYTHQILRQIEMQASRCGNAYQQLAAFSQSLYSTSSSRCAIALASAIGEILRAIEQRVAIDRQAPKSLLQLQATVGQALAILRPLKDLADEVPPHCTDRHILQLVFRAASAFDFGEKFVRGMFCGILRLISVPWIEFVEEWIGTRPELGLVFTTANVGESKGFVRVDTQVFTDDFGREVEETDFHLDADKVPDFLPADIAEVIFETGRNLRFIRSFHPNHPLAKSDVMMAQAAPKMKWLFDWSSVLELEESVKQYEKRVLNTIEKTRTKHYEPMTASYSEMEPGFELVFFGLDQPKLEERLIASMHQLSQPFPVASAAGSLGCLLHGGLTEHPGEDSSAPGETPHWSLVPILSFGGIVSSQAHLINHESLRLLFEAHQVQAHLKVQREFHMLGNGLFCSRISHALFDPELETAERRAGVAMQGGLMGLRLGGRDTWPPASSELRLVLMGVLSESYSSQRSDETNQSAKTSLGATMLPGDLSFAVRDLSEEEIDKCMDPDTLEALDFLRLSYTTPTELTCIITPTHLMHYDRIFKLLLRTLRMLFIVNQLFRDTNRRAKPWDEDSVTYRFVRESQHLVCSIASYFLDSGVAGPWQAFEDKLDDIRRQLDTTNGLSLEGKGVYSPSQIRDMHSQVLERIMYALFLRKRQQPVLKLLEEMFAIILVYAKHARLRALGKLHGDAGPVETVWLYAELKKKLQVFIAVCRGLSEKARAGGRKATKGVLFEGFGTGDDSLFAQLLTKLDMDDYYCRDGADRM